MIYSHLLMFFTLPLKLCFFFSFLYDRLTTTTTKKEDAVAFPDIVVDAVETGEPTAVSAQEEE